jgi:hypothetical protein
MKPFFPLILVLNGVRRNDEKYCLFSGSQEKLVCYELHPDDW